MKIVLYTALILVAATLITATLVNKLPTRLVVEEKQTKIEEAIECQAASSGKSMTFGKAKEIALTSCINGKLTEEYFCNDFTGTWWIDFVPDEVKDGCSPACVVNVKTEEAEVNWRCTGLVGE